MQRPDRRPQRQHEALHTSVDKGGGPSSPKFPSTRLHSTALRRRRPNPTAHHAPSHCSASQLARATSPQPRTCAPLLRATAPNPSRRRAPGPPPPTRAGILGGIPDVDPRPAPPPSTSPTVARILHARAPTLLPPPSAPSRRSAPRGDESPSPPLPSPGPDLYFGGPLATSST